MQSSEDHESDQDELEFVDDPTELPHRIIEMCDIKKGLIVPGIIIHEDATGIKYLYKLNLTQRFFLTVEDPNLSYFGSAIGFFMLAVILLSCIFYVISSLNVFKYVPTSCSEPICMNDATMCPNRMVCEPVEVDWISTVELICVVIFTVEYGTRMLLVWSMPPRLSQTLPDIKAKEMDYFDQTKESDETLFLEELKFLKKHLIQYDDEISEIRKHMLDVKEEIISTKKPNNDPAFTANSIPKEFEDELNKWNRFSQTSDKLFNESGLYKTYLYAIKPLNVIDLLAILPFYIELMVAAGTSVAVVRVLRLVRVFRVFKMGKNSKGVEMLAKTFYRSLPALSLLAFFIALGVILFGAVIFFLESGTFMVTEEYPDGAYLRKNSWGIDEVSPFQSILAACYWAVVCSTTVGYGDLVPTSTAGKCIAILCAYYGVLLLALPITVIGSNFNKLYDASRGMDDEALILDCLDGISKAVCLECKDAENVLHGIHPTTKNNIQSIVVTKTMGIISTFDATKQNLMKDAIHCANDTLNRVKLEELLEAKQSSRMLEQPLRRVNLKPSEAVDLLVGKKKSQKINRETHWTMPQEPPELYLPCEQLGAQNRTGDNLDLEEIMDQLKQLQSAMERVPIN